MNPHAKGCNKPEIPNYSTEDEQKSLLNQQTTTLNPMIRDIDMEIAENCPKMG